MQFRTLLTQKMDHLRNHPLMSQTSTFFLYKFTFTTIQYYTVYYNKIKYFHTFTAAPLLITVDTEQYLQPTVLQNGDFSWKPPTLPFVSMDIDVATCKTWPTCFDIAMICNSGTNIEIKLGFNEVIIDSYCR
jgi:hypothetical protein